MKVLTLPDAAAAASAAAEHIASSARKALLARGTFSLAVSGGSTPEAMLKRLGECDLDWSRIHLFQVDERLAPAGDPSRNAEQLKRALLCRISLPPANLHLMPVEGDEAAAADTYANELSRVLGPERRLDLVHLGLGNDGHTASLVPGDPLCESTRDVGRSQVYQGKPRITLLVPLLNRARERIWLVTGPEKRLALSQLLAGVTTIPAGRIEQADSTLIIDRTALEGA